MMSGTGISALFGRRMGGLMARRVRTASRAMASAALGRFSGKAGVSCAAASGLAHGPHSARTFLGMRVPLGASAAAPAASGHLRPADFGQGRCFHSSPVSADEAKEDYYELLGVSRGAETDEIKRAYYRKAKEFHPDRNSDEGASETFAKINEAWEVLRDDKKRAQYDTFGHAGPQAGFGGGGGGPGFGGGFGGFGGVDAEDVMSNFRRIFEEGGFEGGMGGMGGGARQQARGADVQLGLRLDFEEAVHGCEKEVTFDAHLSCGTCDGSGAKAGTSPSVCGGCHGTGQRVQQNGIFQFATTCPQCHGEGETISDPCGSCHGRGLVRERQTIQVVIPAGVDSGITIRVPGKGEDAPRGGAPGHLFVSLQVRPHELFERDGSDVHIHAPITPCQAILGDTVTVPTLDGDVELKVEPGTQPNERRVLRNRGIPKLNLGTRGHQFVHFKVVIPEEEMVSDRMRELLEECREEEEKAIKEHKDGGKEGWIKSALKGLGRVFG